MEIKTIWQRVPRHCEVLGICQARNCAGCPHKDSFKDVIVSREVLKLTTNIGAKAKPEMRAWIFEKD